MLVPKRFTTLKTCSRDQLVADLTAGLIVGFIISILGGSRVQIGGPTGAFPVIVYGIVQRHGVDGLAKLGAARKHLGLRPEQPGPVQVPA